MPVLVAAATYATKQGLRHACSQLEALGRQMASFLGTAQLLIGGAHVL